LPVQLVLQLEPRLALLEQLRQLVLQLVQLLRLGQLVLQLLGQLLVQLLQVILYLPSLHRLMRLYDQWFGFAVL
jgi:hypothetical protein